jgi:2-polyprenyl-6-hydroxyphenyl methylase/3-demethylubiquinone-9 3-methyltransferase
MAGRYPEDHWSRAEPSAEGLDRYQTANLTPYNRAKFSAFMRLLPRDMGGMRVLDYGGGAGWMAMHCAERGASVTLVDASTNALRLARMLAESRGVTRALTTVRADHVPRMLMGGMFDVVIAKDVIEHIEDDEAFLADLAACCRKDGQLLLSTHNRWSLTWLLEGAYHRLWLGERAWLGWDPTHVRFYSPRSLRRVLVRAGFRAGRWSGVYIVPYDILTWFTLLRRRIVLGGLSAFDDTVGGLFPFNRLGWNVVLRATRA